MATPSPPRLPAGERLRRAGIAAWSVIGILILLAASVWALLRIRVIFPPLVLALIVIYLLNPIVNWLERRGVSRALGAIGTYVVILGGIAIVILSLIPVISGQVAEFRDGLPRFREQAVSFVEGTAGRIETTFGTEVNTAQIECLLGADQTALEEAPTAETCGEVVRRFREQVASQAGRITEAGASILEVLLIFILAPLIALYLLIDLPHLSRDLRALVPESHRGEFTELASKVSAAVGGFFRGQLVVALIVGILSSIGFRIIGLPFWLVVGAVAGFFNLVPLIGPFIGGGIGFLVGALSGDVVLGLWAAAVALIVQQIDNHFISPNVMKRAVNLHPVTVMMSLMAGGTVAGFWGVLLGVPSVAVGKILLGHLWSTRVLGGEAAPAPPPQRREPPSVVTERARADVERRRAAGSTSETSPAPGGSKAEPADGPQPGGSEIAGAGPEEDQAPGERVS